MSREVQSFKHACRPGTTAPRDAPRDGPRDDSRALRGDSRAYRDAQRGPREDPRGPRDDPRGLTTYGLGSGNGPSGHQENGRGMRDEARANHRTDHRASQKNTRDDPRAVTRADTRGMSRDRQQAPRDDSRFDPGPDAKAPRREGRAHGQRRRSRSPSPEPDHAKRAKPSGFSGDAAAGSVAHDAASAAAAGTTPCPSQLHTGY